MKKALLIFGMLIFIACFSDNEPAFDFIPPTKGQDNPMNGEEPQSNFMPCENEIAGRYPCSGFDLLGHLDLAAFSAASGNDVWGWTDTTTGREYVLMGLDNGTAFVDITDTENLIYLGKLPTATGPSAWRDIKVYQDHAFIGAEASGHGMQVFDLTRLRAVNNPPQQFTADFRYTGFGNSHNIVINEATGYAYAVGTNRGDAYNGGAHFIDISDPQNPVLAGGYGDNGYTHDAQVVSYDGPDPDYAGREIFIGANEDQVVLVDVTDKANPLTISTLTYANLGYTHQGWFTEDQRYFILGDELDELNDGFQSRTLVFDFEDLDNPIIHTTYLGPTSAIDHNGYVKGTEFFLANYTAGVRILDISAIEGQTLTEVGYFDSHPENNTAQFEGVWSVYPYFSSGKVVISDISSGLFIIQKSQ